MDFSLINQKFGDPDIEFSQSSTVNWRHCQHRIESWGCPWEPFLLFKTEDRMPCKFPDVPDKSFISGHLKEGTTCENVKTSRKRIDQAPYWSTSVNDADNGVNM